VGQLMSRILGFDINVAFPTMFLWFNLGTSDIYLLKMFLVACKKAVNTRWLK